jgi:hypothetical protein
MQIKIISCAIGVIPTPETRGADRCETGREVFGETIERSQ